MRKILIAGTLFKVYKKPISVMREYTALHGLVPLDELPRHLRGKIPADEIWIRKNAQNKRKIMKHERCELELMIAEGLPYRKAHKRC